MSSTKKQTFLTCSFKLYRPNLNKKEILDNVFEEYSRCVYDGLAWGKLYLKKIKRLTADKLGNYKQDGVYSYLMKVRPKSTWDYQLFSVVRDDALADVARTIAGYLEVKKVQPNASYPNPHFGVDVDTYSEALHELRTVGDNLTEEKSVKRRLLRKPKLEIHPILIDHRNTFTVLATPDLLSFYLFVKLLPMNNGKQLKTAYRGLIDLRTGEEFRHTATDTALLLPIQVGGNGWQWRKFLQAMLEDGRRATAGNETKLVGPPSLKLSRTVDSNGHHEYTAHITFGFDRPTVQEPSACLGVSSGILWNMAFAVTDLQGNILYKERQPTGLSDVKATVNARVAEKQRRKGRVDYRDYRGGAKDQVLHNIANYLIRVAAMRNAVIVLADSTPRQPKSRQQRRNWLATPWKKLCFIIEYKAKLAGVKVRSDMFTAKISRICPYCGGDVKCGKSDKGEGRCRKCKMVEQVELTAAINLARRYSYRASEWVGRGGYIGFHLSFAKGVK